MRVKTSGCCVFPFFAFFEGAAGAAAFDFGGDPRVTPVRIGSVSKNLTLRLLGSVFSSVRFAGSGS